MTTVKTEVVASQVSDPWTATKRTMLAVFLSSGAVLTVVAEILREFAAAFTDLLPGSVIAWALGAAAFCTATAGLVTRIMAIPAVNEALRWLRMKAESTTLHTPVAPVEYKPLTTIPDYPNK